MAGANFHLARRPPAVFIEATMSTTPASSPCDFCGRPEAHPVADIRICDECYIAKGSCCAGEEEECPPNSLP